jgi:hypothetical protein
LASTLAPDRPLVPVAPADPTAVAADADTLVDDVVALVNVNSFPASRVTHPMTVTCVSVCVGAGREVCCWLAPCVPLCTGACVGAWLDVWAAAIAADSTAAEHAPLIMRLVIVILPSSVNWSDLQ